MNFEAANGKMYREVLMKPPQQIECHHCDGTMEKTPYVLIVYPCIHQYECACGAKARIQEKATHEHWPEDIQKEYKERTKKWFEAGMPMRKEVGACIFNPKALDKIDIGGGDGKEEGQVQKEKGPEEEAGG